MSKTNFDQIMTPLAYRRFVVTAGDQTWSFEDATTLREIADVIGGVSSGFKRVSDFKVTADLRSERVEVSLPENPSDPF